MAGNKPDYDDDGRVSDHCVSDQHPAVGNCLETEKIVNLAAVADGRPAKRHQRQRFVVLLDKRVLPLNMDKTTATIHPMKKSLLFGLITLLAGPLFTATASPTDEVVNAAKKLAGEANYSWNTAVTNVSGTGIRGGPSEGKIAKDGTTWISMTRNGGTMEIVMQGGKTAVKTPDNGWQSLADATADDQGPGRFLGRMAQGFKSPAAQAEDLAGKAKAIQSDGDTYAGDLTEDGVKALLSFGRPGDDNSPTVSNAKGSVKFWVKDGELVKFEFNLQGTVSFNGNDRDVNRTTTVEIKNVGATQVTVPDEAVKKLSS